MWTDFFTQLTETNKVAVLGIVGLGVVGAWQTKDGAGLMAAINILGGFIGGVAVAKASL